MHKISFNDVVDYINFRSEILRIFNDSTTILYTIGFNDFPDEFRIYTDRKISIVTIKKDGTVLANEMKDDGKYTTYPYKCSDYMSALSFVIRQFNSEWK